VGVPVSIEDQVLLVCVFRKCFVQLLHDLFARRVLGHIPVDDLPAIEPNQDRQYRIRKLTVIAVKNSIPVIASR